MSYLKRNEYDDSLKLKVERDNGSQKGQNYSYSFLNAKEDFYTILKRDPDKIEKTKNYIQSNLDLSKEDLAEDILTYYIFDGGYWDKLWERLKPSQIKALKEQVYNYFEL